MQPLPVFHNVEINAIELSNRWSLHPGLCSAPSTTLQSSVQRVGLLQPPILLQLPENKYQLLCGHSRLVAHQNTVPTKTELTCLVLELNSSPQQILYTIVTDQLLSGNLTPIEKAYFFKYCLEYMEIKSAAQAFLPLLNEKIQIHTINKLTKLLLLEADIQLSVHNGIINEKIAHELLASNSDERQILHKIFLDLELGGGKQKRLMALSKDLAYGEGRSVTDIFSDTDCLEILEHPAMNKPQKIANLLTTLQKQLFPNSNAAEEEFLKKTSNWELPTTCSISHSQAFERDDIEVTLRFANIEAVEQKLSEIKRLMQS